VIRVPAFPDAGKLAKLGVKRLSAGSGISQIIWHHAATLAEKFLKNGDSGVLNNNPMPYAKLQGLF
jgi:hypothetical protein